MARRFRSRDTGTWFVAEPRDTRENDLPRHRTAKLNLESCCEIQRDRIGKNMFWVLFSGQRNNPVWFHVLAQHQEGCGKRANTPGRQQNTTCHSPGDKSARRGFTDAFSPRWLQSGICELLVSLSDKVLMLVWCSKRLNRLNRSSLNSEAQTASRVDQAVSFVA